MQNFSDDVINVDVYDNANLHQNINNLLTRGFNLNFISNLSVSSIKKSKAHLFILNIDYLNDASDAFLLVSEKPFLIYSFSNSLLCSKTLTIFEKSVGYISQYASVDEICINIKLGLLRFKERNKFVERMQNLDEKFINYRITGIAVGLLMGKTQQNETYVLDKIKLVSRSKQRRVFDVAQDIIDLYTTEDRLNQEDKNLNIEKWLMNKIVHRNNM